MLAQQEVKEDQGKDEHAAAAALAEMNQTPVEIGSGHDSDSESSIASSDSSAIPKAVHCPPVSNMMVDHTYTDYSVVDEKMLSYLHNDEDQDSESVMSYSEKKTKEKALKKIKLIFGDISPTRKNSGGVVKPFPERVSFIVFQKYQSCFIWIS